MKKILVPIDLSGESSGLINYAVAFANEFKYRLLFFHSLVELIPTNTTQANYEATVLSLIQVKEKQLIKKIAKGCKIIGIAPSAIHTDYEVRYGGRIADAILEVANAKEVDLILISTHGSSGLKKFFFGSSTSSVISNAEVPVLAIPLRYKFKTIKQIIYATDLKNPVNELKLVKFLANKFETKVEALNFNYGELSTNFDFQNLLKSSDVNFIEVRTNIEYTLLDNIRTYMKRKPACFLCMFTKHNSTFTKWFDGINVSGLVEKLAFPLLSLPKT
jgi:nucleotide-binding universal stress UspA family protein